MSARLIVHFSGVGAAHLGAMAGLTPAAAPSGDSSAAACALFGLSGAPLPLAAITYTHDFGAPPPAWCARLDPVCLMPSGATLRLFDLAPTPLSEQEAAALFERVATAGVIPGVHWRLGAAQRWYVLSAQAPALRTHPPESLVDGQVADRQPTGGDAARWQGWLNELQMLLFDAPANLAREARDLPPANGLWLWGGGTAPALAPRPLGGVWTDQPLIGGLARLAGRPPQPVPEPTADWFDALPEGPNLLGLGDDAAQPQRAAAWLDALQAALDRRRLAGVTLHAGGGVFEVRRQGRLAQLRRSLDRGLRRVAGRRAHNGAGRGPGGAAGR